MFCYDRWSRTGSILRFTDPPTQRTRDIVRRIASQSPSSLPDRHVGTVSMLARCRRSCIHQERVSSGFQTSDGTRHGLPTDHQRHQLTPTPGAEPLDTASWRHDIDESHKSYRKTLSLRSAPQDIPVKKLVETWLVGYNWAGRAPAGVPVVLTSRQSFSRVVTLHFQKTLLRFHGTAQQHSVSCVVLSSSPVSCRWYISSIPHSLIPHIKRTSFFPP